jgi:bifunctional DNA-binding transcriptional regulator/antitoxin component of YhaV-PrlF toxin-antitoxin module
MRYTVTIEEDDAGEAFIELPAEVINTLQINEGDVLNWEVKEDGSAVLTKPYLDEPIQQELFK